MHTLYNDLRNENRQIKSANIIRTNQENIERITEKSELVIKPS